MEILAFWRRSHLVYFLQFAARLFTHGRQVLVLIPWHTAGLQQIRQLLKHAHLMAHSPLCQPLRANHAYTLRLRPLTKTYCWEVEKQHSDKRC